MEVRTGRIAGIAGESNHLATDYPGSDRELQGLQLEMGVNRHGSIIMENPHVVRLVTEFIIGAADKEIVGNIHDYPTASGMHRRPFRHRDINRVTVLIVVMSFLAIESLRNMKNLASRHGCPIWTLRFMPRGRITEDNAVRISIGKTAELFVLTDVCRRQLITGGHDKTDRQRAICNDIIRLFHFQADLDRPEILIHRLQGPVGSRTAQMDKKPLFGSIFFDLPGTHLLTATQLPVGKGYIPLLVDILEQFLSGNRYGKHQPGNEGNQNRKNLQLNTHKKTPVLTGVILNDIEKKKEEMII